VTPGLPRPVARHLRRPWWWFAISLTITAVVVVLTVRDTTRLRDGSRTWPRVVAEVSPGYEADRHEVPIRYRHPVTDQEVDVKVVVVRDRLLPVPGGAMRVAVDPSNPDVVAVPGDGDEIPGMVFAALVINGVVVAAGVARWLAVRRSAALIASGQAAFAMVGSLEVSRTRRRVLLHLFPLDAPPGAPAVCAFPVLTTGQLPIGGLAFPVEARGRPVPGGAVVVRAGSDILWPLRRPIGSGTGRRPAEMAVVPRPLATVEAPAEPKVPSVFDAVGWARIVLLLGVAVMAVIVSIFTVTRGAEASDIVDRGIAVVARVEGSDEVDRVRLRYRVPGEDSDRVASSASVRTIGRLYPAHVDRDDLGHVQLDADPYNALAPFSCVASGLAATLLLLAGPFAWRREAKRLAAAGPWHPIEEVRRDGNDELAVFVAGEHAPVGRYRGELGRGGVTQRLLLASSFDPDEPAVSGGDDGGLVIAGPPTGHVWEALRDWTRATVPRFSGRRG
jgi:hypothetical protein